MIRLAGAIAKCANIPDTRVTFTNLPATNTNGRRMLSPLLGASQPSAPAKPRHPISRAFTDRTHNERKLQELRSTLPEGDRASMPVTPILMHESEVARVGIGHSDVGSLLETRVQERHMQGSTTSATVIFQVRLLALSACLKPSCTRFGQRCYSMHGYGRVALQSSCMGIHGLFAGGRFPECTGSTAVGHSTRHICAVWTVSGE